MCQTIYPSRNGMRSQDIVALVSFNTVSGIVNLTINAFLVYALWKLDLARKTSYKFILCMCIGDGCVGLLTQPSLTALLLLRDARHKCVYEITAHSFQTTFCQFSVLMILVITLDRFLHMTFLTRYSSYMTKRRGFFLIASSIMITMIIVILNIIGSVYDHHFTIHLAVIAINTIIFIVIFVIYSKTYVTIRSRVFDSHLSRINFPAPTAASFVTRPKSEVKSSKNVIQYHHNFGKAMVFVLVAIVICYLPYFSVLTYVSHSRFKSRVNIPHRDWKTVSLWWTMQLVYINSTINAFIVIASSKQLRKFTRNFLKGQWAANNRQAAGEQMTMDSINFGKRARDRRSKRKLHGKESRSRSI